MTDNIRLGPDAQTNHALDLLRAAAREDDITASFELLPGIHFHADAAMNPGGRYRSPEGRLLELEMTAEGEGGWAGLHLAINAPDLTPFGFLGLACRTAAPEMQVIRPCLRSGTADGFTDCFFDKHILSQPEEHSHLDALPVHGRDRLPLHAPWRELIFFLPTHSFRWSLLDLRLFIV